MRKRGAEAATTQMGRMGAAAPAGISGRTPTASARRGDPFDALGNPYRRAIVELLTREPRSVQEIADKLPISRPAVSRHLRVLNRAGLVVDQQVGTRHLYRLDEVGAEAARRYLAQVWGHAATRFRLFAENTAPAKVKK